MQKNAYILAVAATITAALAGCSGSPTTAPPATQPTSTSPSPTAAVTPAPTPSPSATPPPTVSTNSPDNPSTSGPALNAHGFIEKKFGQDAGVFDPNGNVAWKFRVTGIDVDPACTGAAAEAPTSGQHILFVHVALETTPDLTFDVTGKKRELDLPQWMVFGADGTQENDPGNYTAFACLDESQRLPSTFGPAVKAKGIVPLSAHSKSGSVALVFDSGDGSGPMGWEFKFPQ